MNNIITQIVTSPVTNVILSLLIVFQWLGSRAKEKTVTHNLFAAIRSLERLANSSKDPMVRVQAANLVDSLDATLSTLDTRQPFVEAIKARLLQLGRRYHRESNEGLIHLKQVNKKV